MQRTTLSLYAAETDMTGRRIYGLRMARSGAITAAIIWRAKVRATLKHLSCDSYVRHCRVKALIERNAARVLGGATGLHRRIGMAIGVIIRRPLPDIADHVEQPEGIGRIGPHGGGPREGFELRLQVIITVSPSSSLTHCMPRKVPTPPFPCSKYRHCSLRSVDRYIIAPTS